MFKGKNSKVAKKQEPKPVASKYFNATVSFTKDNDVEIEVEVEAIDHIMAMSTESNYGADADGNRGGPATFVDETMIELETVTVKGTEKDILETLSKSEKDSLEEALAEVAEGFSVSDYNFNNEPTDPRDDDGGYEW